MGNREWGVERVPGIEVQAVNPRVAGAPVLPARLISPPTQSQRWSRMAEPRQSDRRRTPGGSGDGPVVDRTLYVRAEAPW